MIALAAIIAFILALIVPGSALAWGPATHLEIGSHILANPGLVTGAIRDLILRFPYDFLYGTVSADIVVGKNLVEELKHCHNWKVGFKLLKKADGEARKAFAFGYLSHLAADTVAHNNYIPEMMIRSFPTRTLRHAYWELRFDALASEKVWQLPRMMLKRIHRDNDRLLDSVIEDTPLSFRTNRTIFSSLLLLNRIEHWRRMLELIARSSRWKLEPEVKEKYFGRSVEAVVDLLNNREQAACVLRDPTGRVALQSAKSVRKNLKVCRKKGGQWERPMKQAINWIRS